MFGFAKDNIIYIYEGNLWENNNVDVEDKLLGIFNNKDNIINQNDYINQNVWPYWIWICFDWPWLKTSHLSNNDKGMSVTQFAHIW